MKFEKLFFFALLIAACTAVSARADHFSGENKKASKDSVIIKLDSAFLFQNGFWSFSDLIPLESDEVIADRLSCLQSEIPLTFNPYVRNFVDYFTIRNRKYTRRMLERENLYFPLFEKYLQKHNMPVELKYLAVVESALNPKAKSVVGAMGLWQFMPATGNDFRLVQNSFYDERMDPEKSTEAACKFLRQLHRIFGDWELALAAYNCGPGNVKKAIARAGGGKQTFWAIFPYLPKETRGYVPSFTAVMYAMNYAQHHKISSDSLLYAIPTDTVLVSQGIDLEKFSAELNMKAEDLKNLNPALKKNYIPETVRNFAIKVPTEKRVVIAQNRSTIFNNARFTQPKPAYKEPAPTMVAKAEPATPETEKPATDSTQQKVPYKVKRGDYLAKIAKENNVTMAELKIWNNLKSSNVMVGQQLVIFKLGSVQDTTQTTALASAETKDSEAAETEVKPNQTPVKQVAHHKKTASVKNPVKEKLIIHSVQPGDTLWNISRKYNGISVEQIRKKNKLKSDDLKPGQKLVIS